MKILRRSLLVLLFGPIAALQAQPSADAVSATVLAEIEEQHRQEQKAFVEGDCDKVASFFSDEASRYANGRRITSRQEGREFCNSIPRPFGGRGAPPEINDTFYVLSENAAYFVRTIDFDPLDEEVPTFKREVVTKVWSKSNGGWKIVHFHSSVHSVPIPAQEDARPADAALPALSELGDIDPTGRASGSSRHSFSGGSG